MSFTSHFDRQPRRVLLLLGFGLVVTVGVLDHATGPEISFSIFYLVPVSLVAWFVGRRSGNLMSIVGAATWLIVDLLAGHAYSHPTVPYWNATVRLGFFVIVAYSLSALRASRKRQEELGHFIVHDLRAPLSNVMMGLELLQEASRDTTDEAFGDPVELCKVSCTRMLTLIESLLDLARLEGGRMPLEPREVGMSELVDAALQQVAAWAQRNEVSLQSELDEGCGVAYADRELTLRVLVNLLSNAIKCSPPESVVSVRAGSIAAGKVSFTVTDQGPGIPREWADRVFEKFAQVEASRAGAATGAGLGLTFCRLAVEAQGGRIWLESGIDSGTTVTFTLPASRQ